MNFPISSSMRKKDGKMSSRELTYLARQWTPSEDPPLFGFWMASSEVDQKYLGHFAKTTSVDNNYLSSFLFRVLGLSVILAEKLLRARKARRLDPARDLKARQLIHHILWLAREGLIMVEQYVLPMVGNYGDLKVLAYKLRASFYHIFVLFHNNPPANDRVVRSRSGSTGSIKGTYGLFPDPLTPKIGQPKSQTRQESSRYPPKRQRSPAISLGGAVGSGMNTRNPPGLPLPTPFSTNPYGSGGGGESPNTSRDPGLATFLIPLNDYIPRATAAFKAASTLADSLLPGSHPVRLSVKVEYVAYIYDCLKESEVSRRMAKMAIRHVYEAKEGMDDDSFDDAAEMVSILGRMMRRGLGSGTASQAGSGSGRNVGGGGGVNSTRFGNDSATSLRGGGGTSTSKHARAKSEGSALSEMRNQESWV